MRRLLLQALIAPLLFLIGCTSQPPPPEPQRPPSPEFKTTATIKDIMESIIDPSADVIWDAVSTTISFKGTQEKAPQSDEEWDELRRNAIALMEATNLLLMPGRRVARPDEKPEDLSVELPFEEIEQLITRDRQTWQQMAHGLHDSTIPVLEAIQRKDAEALLSTGDGIFQACERCHVKYWYPDDARRERQPSGKQQETEK